MAREDRHRRSAALQKPNPSHTLKYTERTHDMGIDHRDNRHIAYEVLWTCAWTCTVLYRSIRLVHQGWSPHFNIITLISPTHATGYGYWTRLETPKLQYHEKLAYTATTSVQPRSYIELVNYDRQLPARQFIWVRRTRDTALSIN